MFQQCQRSAVTGEHRPEQTVQTKTIVFTIQFGMAKDVNPDQTAPKHCFYNAASR